MTCFVPLWIIYQLVSVLGGFSNQLPTFGAGIS